MAEFCRDCIIKIIGSTVEESPEWWCGEEGLCEGCGFDYLKKEKTK